MVTPCHPWGCLNRLHTWWHADIKGDNDKCHRWQWVCHSQAMPFSTIPPQRCSLHWSQSPCQVVKPAHPYACCYTWNSVHLFVQLCGCRCRHADRMPFAPRPMIQHRSADWEKEATKILRAHWYAAEELPFLVEKVVSAYPQTDLKLIYTVYTVCMYIYIVSNHFHYQSIICLPLFAKYLLLTSIICQKRNSFHILYEKGGNLFYHYVEKFD